jgi:hypothetical protein
MDWISIPVLLLPLYDRGPCLRGDNNVNKNKRDGVLFLPFVTISYLFLLAYQNSRNERFHYLFLQIKFKLGVLIYTALPFPYCCICVEFLPLYNDTLFKFPFFFYGRTLNFCQMRLIPVQYS